MADSAPTLNVDDIARSMLTQAVNGNNFGLPPGSQPGGDVTNPPNPHHTTDPPATSPEGLTGKLAGILDYAGRNIPEASDDRIAQDVESLVAGMGKTKAELEQAQQELERSQSELVTQKRHLQDYLENLDEFTKYQESQKAPQTNQPTEPTWQTPDYDPAWEQMVKLNQETGRYEPAAEYISPSVAEKVNRWADWQRETARRVTMEPWKVALEAGGKQYLDEFEQRMLEKIGEAKETTVAEVTTQQQERQQQSDIGEYFNTHANVLFRVDDKGQYEFDTEGNAVLTEAGRVYSTAQEQAQSYGIEGDVALHRFASDRVAEYQRAQHDISNPQTPDEKNAELKDRFLEREDAQPTPPPASREPTAPNDDWQLENFKNMILTDPENATILGSDFKG